MIVSRAIILRFVSSFILSLLLNMPLTAQPPIQWQKCLGGTNDDNATGIRQTADGGYIVTGSTISNNGDVPNNNGFVDYWVVKLDRTGQIVWQRALGGSQSDVPHSVEQTSDGGFVVAGYATSADGMVRGNHGYTDFWIVRLDADGNPLWEKSLGSSGYDAAYSILQTKDGGFIISGNVSEANGDVSHIFGIMDAWLVRLDAAGNKLWQKSYGGSGIDNFEDIGLTPDGGFIITGYTKSNDGGIVGNKGKDDLWVVKTDGQGNVQWQKVFGGSATDAGKSVKVSADGGYIIAGLTNSSDGDVTGHKGDFDFWVIKLDATGNLQWEKCYGGTGSDAAVSIHQLPDNGYLIGGQSSSTDGHTTGNHGAMDMWLIKTDASGALIWQRNYGGPGAELLGEVDLTADGWFIAAGSTNSKGGEVSGLHGNSFDFWVVKFGPDPRCTPTLQLDVSRNNICMGTPVTFTATVQNGGTAPVFRWKKNNTAVGTNSPTYIPVSLRDGDVVLYEYQARTACGRDTTITSNPITMRVINDVEPVVTIEASKTAVCEGEMVTFNATPHHGLMTPSYQWLLNGNPVGGNSTTFSSTNLADGARVECLMTIATPSCPGTTKDYSNVITIKVNSFVTPAVRIQSSAAQICKGAEVIFTAIGNGGNSARYQWKVNGSPAGPNAATFTTTALADGDKISCTMEADPQTGCLLGTTAQSNEITINVREATAPSITILASHTEVCEGASIRFYAQTEHAGNDKNYQWQINGRDVGTGESTFTHSGFSDNDLVTCILKTDNTGCPTTSIVSSNAISIRVKEVPTISFTPAQATIMSGQSTQLNASVSGSIASFIWHPHNALANPLSLTPTTIPLSANQFFSLKVLATNGCEASGSILVKVYTRLLLPTAFTPNGDGLNDVFRIPPGAFINLKEFSVFDRWGNRVFTTADPNKGWNGTLNGNRLNSGTYIYIVKGSTDEGEVNLKGTVNLIQ